MSDSQKKVKDALVAVAGSDVEPLVGMSLEALLDALVNCQSFEAFVAEVEHLPSHLFHCCPHCGVKKLLYVPTGHIYHLGSDVRIMPGDLVCLNCKALFKVKPTPWGPK